MRAAGALELPGHCRGPQSLPLSLSLTLPLVLSLSPCSSGHLASHHLIYLWLCVIGQWESIVAPDLPHLRFQLSVPLLSLLSYFSPPDFYPL